MATLSVFKFHTPDGAERALEALQDLQKQHLLQIEDAAMVVWPKGAKKPKTKQTVNLTGVGALGGAFWGMLFGLIFFVPLFGLAIGAAMGALASHFADYGINDDFIKDMRSKITEGTSALFLLTSNAVEERMVERLKELPKFDILATNLTAEQEEKLRAALG